MSRRTPLLRMIILVTFIIFVLVIFITHKSSKDNIDENPNQPTKYGVRGIPTMLLFKNGQLKATKVGATTKSNIVSWIRENI